MLDGLDCAGFLLDQDPIWLDYYATELAFNYPFPWSADKLGYVAIPGLSPEALPKMTVSRLHQTWEPPATIAQMMPGHLRDWRTCRPGAMLYDGNAARCADITVGALPALVVQRVRYPDYVGTNLMLDHHPETGSLRAHVHPDGVLEPLSKSLLGNIIGISHLLVGRDGQLPLQMRAERVAVRPGQVCSSVSGSLEMADIPHDGVALSQCDLLREVREEIGEGFVREKVASVTILGMSRELVRGGQPELFLLVEGAFDQMDVTRAHRTARDGLGQESAALIFCDMNPVGDIYDRAHVSEVLQRLETSVVGGMAVPLKAHIALWLRHLMAANRLL